MPELPEVESLIRSLRPYVVGQKIMRIDVRRPKLVSARGNVRRASARKAVEFSAELTGQRIDGITRRAKNIIFHFQSGKLLVVHLKMTGQLMYQKNGAKPIGGGHPMEISEHILPHQHTHIIFTLEKGILYYNDTRKFGYLLYFPNEEALERTGHFDEIGADPLSENFTSEYFRTALQHTKGSLKAVLLNQKVVAGLGNIYCDEACFVAGLKPNRRAASLQMYEVKKLYKAIKRILLRAITLGGSSIADYLLADGSRGNYAREHLVYGRGGESCARCKNPLISLQLAGRTTVFCKKCQR